MRLDQVNEIRVLLWFHHGTLVDFVILHRTLDRSGDWVEVSRVDCAHGTCHRHQSSERHGELEKLELVPIRSRTDVGKAYDRAYNLVLDGYEDHLRRWTRGR